MGSGLVALVAGASLVVLSPGAGAQTADLPLHSPVTVTPREVSTPGQKITVTGPGFPGGQGCRFAQIRALTDGQTFDEGRILDKGIGLDDPWSFEYTAFDDGPFTPGTFKLFLYCSDEFNNQQTYRTDPDAGFTVLASATTTTTTTTTLPPSTTSSSTATTAPAGTAGTVEPSSVKPGVDTITIRGGGFKAGAQLTITLNSTPVTALGTTDATATGAYAATLKLPASAPPGAQQLVVSGPGPDDAPRSTRASLTVQDLNCTDFATSTAAQAAMGAGGADPHGLDADRDGVACETVSARSARSAAGTSGTAAAAGALPATGTSHAPFGIMAGLTAMTLGALLVGLSYPATPAAGHHRRRRGRHR